MTPNGEVEPDEGGSPERKALRDPTNRNVVAGRPDLVQNGGAQRMRCCGLIGTVPSAHRALLRRPWRASPFLEKLASNGLGARLREPVHGYLIGMIHALLLLFLTVGLGAGTVNDLVSMAPRSWVRITSGPLRLSVGHQWQG